MKMVDILTIILTIITIEMEQVMICGGDNNVHGGVGEGTGDGMMVIQ